MTLIIPLQAVASQTLAASIAGQATQLNIFQKTSGLYMDVYLNNSVIITGVLCQNFNIIIRNSYFGYIGDFGWWDNQGADDPYYTGLGSRFTLLYLAPTDLPPGIS